eukprot:TRINITY_DN8906_c0_g1_i1.p1 TRINITY_DN8906_c0_g1~~TRINITY_DN8906_c0_g1_i1.p1  ORF type:complete len:513 (+),score=136.73 TRINITY_DN8906_c0_g1_i1:65-1603(+)
MEHVQVKFPDAFGSVESAVKSPKTLVELSLMELSATIRRKPEWEQKRKNSDIVSKWKEEAKQQSITEEQFLYVMEELEYYEGLKNGKMEVSAVDGIWQADELIPEELHKQLINQVKRLEEVPESQKDWHPGSNKQVLDLLHPSLFCLVYGHSRASETNISLKDCLKKIGEGKMINPPSTSTDYSTSKKYQWLPSDFSISTSGKTTIQSYINNLHPMKYSSLYNTLASIFDHFIPLFNRVLTDALNPRPLRYKVDPYDWYHYDNVTSGSLPPLTLPPLGSFQPPPPPNIKYQLEGKEVQVIVKLANIELTPENPSYDGGVWHVEGMQNESIVASGIFYYHSENITESRLAFRQAIVEPEYDQSDFRGIEQVYGLESDKSSLNQYLGSVVTQQGRCLVFPNIYQHKVAPFELRDGTKPGHRKILVFFLVDPTKKILSTSTVSPQQSHWLAEELRQYAPFNQLPRELVEGIAEVSNWPMSMKSAKEHREELMKERKYFIGVNTEIFEREFSMCEH